MTVCPSELERGQKEPCVSIGSAVAYISIFNPNTSHKKHARFTRVCWTVRKRKVYGLTCLGSHSFSKTVPSVSVRESPRGAGESVRRGAGDAWSNAKRNTAQRGE
eukprot:SAG11_NODE_641_length_8008_cov_2.916171_6_plen_105_part_00